MKMNHQSQASYKNLIVHRRIGQKKAARWKLKSKISYKLTTPTNS